MFHKILDRAWDLKIWKYAACYQQWLLLHGRIDAFDIFLKIPFSLKIVTKYLLEFEFVNTQQLLSLPKRLPPHVANRVQLVHSPAITQSRFQLKNINSIAN